MDLPLPLRLSLALAAASPWSCLAAEEAPAPSGRVAIDVAALSLAGVADAEYTLTVTNGAGGAGDVVWTRTLRSSSHGDGSGALSYVGTCDAATGVNSVILDLDALYDAGGAIAPETYLDPTPLTQEVSCVADRDTPVQFDLTVARQAQQGFFDVAVQFDDLFCSAKFDCCDPATGTACAGDGSDDIRLLFTADGVRGRTFVMALACTAGLDASVVTALVLDDLVLDCDVNSIAGDFAPDVTIDPVGDPPGNLCDAGDLSACAAVTEYGSADADSYLFQVAVYAGSEPLPNAGVAAHKVYWNVALGVLPGVSACTLRTRGSAYDAADPAGPPIDRLYPYIQWDVDLASCGAEQLAFNSAGATVAISNAPFALRPVVEAPVIGYAASVSCVLGQPCTIAAPTDSGGAVARYAVSPDLPAGLSLDARTGIITGTPTSVTAAATYTVTATNAAGAGQATLDLAVIDVAPSSLAYAPSALTCTRGTSCSLGPPTHAGGAVVSYGISPALPAGLSLNTTTGVLSGTPTAVSASASYTVTATNSGGSTQATVSVTVNDIAPSSLVYSPSTLTCAIGTSCSLGPPTHAGGTVVSYGISPSLPAGLSLNTSTGVISGTPTVASAATSYTVTATNSGGSTTATVTVTVNNPAFSSATFTNAGASGGFGPTQTQINSAYAGGPLAGKVTVTDGVQAWTVPATGTYRIEAYGAEGAGTSNAAYSAGKGARMRGDFSLTAGTVLNIVVGQMGGNYSGGGGGTFVWRASGGTLLIAAGGGGAAGGHPTVGYWGNGNPGVTGTSGTAGNGGAAGGTSGGAGNPGA
ncbi:MAG: hypothetical protein EP329_25475, partial [Deltaproteobacteria bacterium]